MTTAYINMNDEDVYSRSAHERTGHTAALTTSLNVDIPSYMKQGQFSVASSAMLDKRLRDFRVIAAMAVVRQV